MNRYALLFCCLLVLNIGCQQADTGKQASEHGHSHDHDHFGRPKTLKAAIEKLVKMRDTISDAMDKSDPESAHDPLHDVGDLLKAMPDLAADTDLEESDWFAIKVEVDRLFDAFADVDLVFHSAEGDKQAAFDKAKSTINEGVAVLESYLPKLGGTGSDAKHNHDEHDDHGDHDEGHDEDDHEDDDHDHDDHHDEESSHEKPSE